MPSSPQIESYLRFMKWFSSNYPNLHRHYWQYITAPTDGSEVGIKGTDLDAVIYEELVQLQYDFYHPEEMDANDFLSKNRK